MRIQQYYQSGRYGKDATKWRKEIYFPMRTEWLIENLPKKPSGKILDAGCGDGGMLLEIKKLFPLIDVYGVDISRVGCEIAERRGIKTKVADLNKKIPERNNFFDFVIAHEVIEHLIDPDRFLEESHRVLKKGGHLIITTPNLVAWYHRVLFIFGFYPLFLEMSTRSRSFGLGPLKKIIKNRQPVGHMRIFTVPALKDMLGAYGFKVVKVKGSTIAFGFPGVLGLLYDTLDFIFSFKPALSSNMMVVARKK